MALAGRTKLKSGIRKLKARGRGPALSAADKHAKKNRGKRVSPEEIRSFARDTRGNKGASNQGDKPKRKFANAQNQSKGHARFKKELRKVPQRSSPELPDYVYQTDDDSILEDVRERLANHRDIDTVGIDIGVNRHTVTLSGRVGNRREKLVAEDVAREAWGVKRVRNDLTIVRGRTPNQRRKAA